MPMEACMLHGQSTELGKDVGVLCDQRNIALPLRKYFSFLSLIWTCAKRTAEVVEDYCRFRKTLRKLGQFGKLGVKKPCIERHIEFFQPGKALCKLGRKH